ncbi:hypothetical protein E2320_010725 [Naja naja]|nr:hypothetical protein E2320_010725 [Naja naja]
MPGLLLGDEAPNFQADTTHGPIRFHEFLGDSWGILFSHPRDFTPVCTTELGRAAKLAPEFAKRNVKLIALSIDDVSDHLAWCKDINAYNSDKPIDKLPFPIIADLKRELSVQLGMLDPDEIGKDGMPLTARVSGDQVMVVPSVSDEEAKKLFPGGICTKQLPSGKNYLRYTSP